MLDTIVNRSKYNFREAIVASQRINWRIEDIIGGEKTLDFTKPFLPENLARVAEISFLNGDEKLILNHIRGHAYLSIFGLVEEFILPFVLDHLRPSLDENDYRVRALLQFAGEEAKHIQLFKVFSREFKKNFGTQCKVIGPPLDVSKFVLSHQPLAVALTVLHIEWMTQSHYIEAIRHNPMLDSQFKSLLRHHWMEEAQHTKLDTLMIEALAKELNGKEITTAIEEYLEIVNFLSDGLKQQTIFDLEAFEVAAERKLNSVERREFVKIQHQANRWTYLGTGMIHPNFLDTLNYLSSEQKKRIEEITPEYC